MADDEASIDSFLSDEPKKKESIMPFIAAIGVVSLVAVGAGWFVSGLLAPTNTAQAPTETAKANDKAAKGDKPESDEEGESAVTTPAQVMRLEPVLVSLSDNTNTYLRMELALVFGEEGGDQSEEAKLRIGSEIAAFARTLTLRKISGPSGYLHLRDDLLDRARLATSGAVKELLILSLVSE